MIFGLDAFAPLAAGLVLVGLFVTFAREWRSPEVSALAAASIMLVLGLISSADLVGVLANSAPVTIGAMFIMSAALARTGALDAFTRMFIDRVAHRPQLAVLGFLFITAVISAFMNNMPQVMMMIPVAVALAQRLNESGSRLLIPLSYATILGGTISQIGTSTNIIVDGVAQEKGLAPFHMFEIAPLGIISSVVGVFFIFFFRKLLPERGSAGDIFAQNKSQRFIVEIVIEDDSPYLGARPREVKAFNEGDRRVVDVIRGDASLRRDMENVALKEGDIVVLKSPMAEILTMMEQGQVPAADAPSPRPKGLQPISARNTSLVEVLLVPGAHFIGRTLRHLRLRRRYGVYPVALHRGSENIGERFEQTPLAVGDTILIDGAPEDLKRLVEDNDLVNVAAPTERPVRRGRAPIAIATLAAVVIFASFGVMPIAGLAVIGAAFVMATRCVEPEEAFESVDWRILALILAMLAVGKGIENSGLAEILVTSAAPALKMMPAVTALALIYLISMTMTEIVTANAVAIIMTPLAIGLARELGSDPRPFVVAVMFAASASFMTPIGYQTNTLVYNVGGYKFTDYLRLGVPLNAICAVIAILLIPIFWPLTP